MEKLYREFGNRVEFVGINVSVKKDIPDFVKKYHLTFPISFDEGGKIASLFDAKIETNVLIDRKGVIILKERDFREDMDKYLKKLLQ